MPADAPAGTRQPDRPPLAAHALGRQPRRRPRQPPTSRRRHTLAAGPNPRPPRPRRGAAAATPPRAPPFPAPHNLSSATHSHGPLCSSPANQPALGWSAFAALRRHGPRSLTLGAGRIEGAVVWPTGALESAPTTPFRCRSSPPAALCQDCPSIQACELRWPQASLRWRVAAVTNLDVRQWFSLGRPRARHGAAIFLVRSSVALRSQQRHQVAVAGLARGVSG